MGDATARAETSTQPEDLFAGLFAEVFGLEQGRRLVPQHPVADIGEPVRVETGCRTARPADRAPGPEPRWRLPCETFPTSSNARRRPSSTGRARAPRRVGAPGGIPSLAALFANSLAVNATFDNVGQPFLNEDSLRGRKPLGSDSVRPSARHR